HERYDTKLVRLVHGDENPAGRGFKQVRVASSIDGERAGRRQDLRSGSSATLAIPAGSLDGSFTFAVFVQVTAPPGREAIIATRGDPYGAVGWALAISATGELMAV